MIEYFSLSVTFVDVLQIKWKLQHSIPFPSGKHGIFYPTVSTRLGLPTGTQNIQTSLPDYIQNLSNALKTPHTQFSTIARVSLSAKCSQTIQLNRSVVLGTACAHPVWGRGEPCLAVPYEDWCSPWVVGLIQCLPPTGREGSHSVSFPDPSCDGSAAYQTVCDVIKSLLCLSVIRLCSQGSFFVEYMG